MTDTEFLAYMTAAADDRVMVSADQMNRLFALYGSDGQMRVGWWGTVDPAHIRWAVERAQKRLRA